MYLLTLVKPVVTRFYVILILLILFIFFFNGFNFVEFQIKNPFQKQAKMNTWSYLNHHFEIV